MWFVINRLQGRGGGRVRHVTEIIRSRKLCNSDFNFRFWQVRVFQHPLYKQDYSPCLRLHQISLAVQWHNVGVTDKIWGTGRLLTRIMGLWWDTSRSHWVFTLNYNNLWSIKYWECEYCDGASLSHGKWSQLALQGRPVHTYKLQSEIFLHSLNPQTGGIFPFERRLTMEVFNLLKFDPTLNLLHVILLYNCYIIILSLTS